MVAGLFFCLFYSKRCTLKNPRITSLFFFGLKNDVFSRFHFVSIRDFIRVKYHRNSRIFLGKKASPIRSNDDTELFLKVQYYYRSIQLTKLAEFVFNEKGEENCCFRDFLYDDGSSRGQKLRMDRCYSRRWKRQKHVTYNSGQPSYYCQTDPKVKL